MSQVVSQAEPAIMQSRIVVTGSVADSRKVKRDEALSITGAKVRMTIKPIDVNEPVAFNDVMAEIRRRQSERGFKPSSQSDVDAYVNSERDSWGS